MSCLNCDKYAEIESAKEREIKTDSYENNNFFDEEDAGWDEDDVLGGTPFPRWG